MPWPMLFEALEHIADREPHAAPFNMAMDETLLRGLAPEMPAIRIYRWSAPAVSFGYFERVAAALEAFPEREPVRRWTGGGIVPHGFVEAGREDVTYSLLVPPGMALARLTPGDSYRLIHAALRRLLEREGIAGCSPAEPGPEESRACFEKPVRHDIVIGPRKIAGAAQRRTRWGLLHQGSIQNVRLPPRFEDLLPGAFSAHTRERSPTVAEKEKAVALAAGKYAASAWTHRR